MAGNLRLAILGGGPAGLAVGYYARKAGHPFTLFEAAEHVGGNCITFEQDGFRFDSGAHRFHDKLPDVTREVQQLLGSELRKIEVPSQIWHAKRLYDFPIAPFNLLKALGPWEFTVACASLLRGRLGLQRKGKSFREFALRKYGADIASRFLLNYSEKLWGAPCDQLSSAICGARLKGLGVTSLLVEMVHGQRAKTRHLDGSFFYPREGYGTIIERLADACGRENIRLATPVTRIVHSAGRVDEIEIQGAIRHSVEEVASTLPLGLLLRLLDPAPPAALLQAVQTLRYRHVVLVAVFIAKERITRNGSVYFPDPGFPFTRVYEPRNRSELMAPPGCTSLVAEIPCQTGDPVWGESPESLVARVIDHYVRIGWLRPADVVGATTRRLQHAYPILDLDYESRLAPILEYLATFQNLKLAGRNGCFVYSHLHDMLRHGRDLVARLSGETRRVDPPAGVLPPHDAYNVKTRFAKEFSR